MSVCNPCSGTTGLPASFPGFPPPVGSGSTSSGSSSSTPTTPGTDANGCPIGVALAVTSASFVMPAIGSPGSFESLCAYLWAIPGNEIIFQPLGRIQITGVSGNVVTFVNVTVPAGFNILAGTRIFQTGPLPGSTYTPAAQLSTISGFTSGNPTTLAGGDFQLLRAITSGGNIFWQPVNGQIFTQLAAPFLLIDGAESTNPITTGVATVTPTYSLPGLPTALPGSFGVSLTIKLTNPTNETSAANGFWAEYGGTEIARCQAYANVQHPIIRATGSTIQIQFNKVAARTTCVALVYVNGYWI